MGSFVKRRAFIPVAEAPAEMPEGIEARYYTHEYGEFKEITQDNVKRIMKNLRGNNCTRKFENSKIFLCNEKNWCAELYLL